MKDLSILDICQKTKEMLGFKKKEKIATQKKLLRPDSGAYATQQMTGNNQENGVIHYSVLDHHDEPTKVSSHPEEIAFRMKDLTRHAEEQIYNEIEKEILDRVEALMYGYGVDFETVIKIMSLARIKEKQEEE